MNALGYPQSRALPCAVVTAAYIVYVALLILSFARVGWAITPLTIIPVIGGSWYFGIKGGLLAASLCILTNVILPVILAGSSLGEFLRAPGNLQGSAALLLLSIIMGRISSVTHERREVVLRLENLEKERLEYTKFLQSLNEIIRTALEARDLKSALEILVERIAKLFEADDAFFAFWNEDNKITTPVIAHGSLSKIYPKMTFEPGERTLTLLVMEREHPLAIPDLKSSSVSTRIVSTFPSLSMLGIPLIVQGNKIAAFYLGYNTRHHFDRGQIARTEIAAQQIAVVLTKVRILDDAQKQIKQLTVLHEVALISTQVESTDQLIERVTEIIGKNLFPDNFGILLMDEEKGVLRPHPSYRSGSEVNRFPTEILLGQGITGQVAQMGESIRIGDIDGIQNYLHVDKGTSSELCVPIKFKDRVLGVINTESTKTDAFSEEDELLLGTLAGQLATSIERLRAAAAERQWLDQLAHSNDLIYALAHITTHIEKALSPEEVLEVLGRELKQINLTCTIAMHDSHRELFSFSYSSMEAEFIEWLEDWVGLPLAKYPFSLDKINLRLNAQKLIQPKFISNPEEEIQTIFEPLQKESFSGVLEGIGFDAKAVLIRLPLLFEENLLGILWLWGKDITSADLPVMSIFARQIAISLEHARLFQEVQNLAATDSLTGLHNRRSLFELGRIEFARAHRMNRPFSCMMLDIDHFKEINDNYGHQVGDQVLHEFAQRCQRLVREVDLVGRYGGEEILIFLPETDSDTAMQVAERLRASIETTPIRISELELNITVSIGVSRKDENTLEMETLISRADQALYIAKHKGRNRVAISV